MVVNGTGGVGSAFLNRNYPTSRAEEKLNDSELKPKHKNEIRYSNMFGYETPTPQIEIGMGMYSEPNLDSYLLTDLVPNNILTIRLDIPTYTDATAVSDSKAGVRVANTRGCRVIWGVTSGVTTITDVTWVDFHTAILEAAQWAQDNGVYEFQLGNEEELHNDDVTMTEAQLRTNLRSTATEVQAIFTRGKVSYSCSADKITGWCNEGKGDIDLLAMNVYRGNAAPFNDDWQTYINNLTAAFDENCYLTEFSLSTTNIENYSTDEDVQAAAVGEMIDYARLAGIKRACFFYYGKSNLFGVRKTDGTYRTPLWNLLKTNNPVPVY